MPEVETGKLIEGLGYEAYALADGLRSTHLKYLDRSPAHLKTALAESSEPTPAQTLGRLLHAALLEPSEFLRRCVVEPEFVGLTKDRRPSSRSKEALDQKARWYQSLRPDQMVMSTGERDQITGMLNSMLNHPLVSKLLSGASKEVSLWWNEDDVLCKCRYDFVTSDGVPFDVKTTIDASPRVFERTLFSESYKYYLQASHYAAGAKETKLLRGNVFGFIGIEKDPPYGVCIKTLDHYGLQPGESIRKPLLNLYKRCKKDDKWPSYGVEATNAVPPPWLFREDFGG